MDREILVELNKHPKAKRYTIRVYHDGRVAVTVPRWGTHKWAARFARQNREWIWSRLPRGNTLTALQPGDAFLYRGEARIIHTAPHPDGIEILLGDQSLILPSIPMDLKPVIENHLRQVSAIELRPRTVEMARQYGISIQRIRIGGQKTRWGSCSSTGTISLNWRLIQTPLFVRDYIILHELTHRLHMNHSHSFWRTLEGFNPHYMEAEKWLKSNRGLLA